MTPLDASKAVAKPINLFGSRFMFAPDFYAGPNSVGYSGFDFYFAGRGGVLGEVDAVVIEAAFGFMHADLVAGFWNQGRAVGPVATAATMFADGCAAWGREHFGAPIDYGRLSHLASMVIAAASPVGIPLFAAWREMPVPDDDRGAAAHRINLLREFRGCTHIMSVMCSGATPLAAVLNSGGPGNAKLLGYSEPFPDISADIAALAAAEETTNRLAALPLEVLSADERSEFVALVTAAYDGLV